MPGTSLTEPALITVNQINLTGKQLLAGILGICSLLTTGFAGGYLFVPARQADVTALTTIVENTRKDQAELRTLVAGLTEQTARMTVALDGLQVVLKRQQAATTYRAKPKPQAAAGTVQQSATVDR